MRQGCADEVHPAREHHWTFKQKGGTVPGCPQEGVFQVQSVGRDGWT